MLAWLGGWLCHRVLNSFRIIHVDEPFSVGACPGECAFRCIFNAAKMHLEQMKRSTENVISESESESASEYITGGQRPWGAVEIGALG